MVPVVGVEPTRYRYHWILSPARLPIPSHRRITLVLYHIVFKKSRGFKKFFCFFFAILRLFLHALKKFVYFGNGCCALFVGFFPVFRRFLPFCRSVQKTLVPTPYQKYKKFSFFMKNGKNHLTNGKKGAKIVNCIIIARTVGIAVPCRILYSSKLHKIRWDFCRKTQ